MDRHKPPKHLRAATRRWFAAVVADYDLQAHHVRLLTLACQAWDRAEQAREILDRDGLTFADKAGNPRARPEVAIERDSRLAFARLLRELALDVEAPDVESRPPAIAPSTRKVS
jgi:P27 family predicted phage terminase small subunit